MGSTGNVALFAVLILTCALIGNASSSANPTKTSVPAGLER